MDPFLCEDTRLASFVNFPDVPGIDPTILAAAGFCYLGEGDEVSCFKCKVTKKGWKPNESPLDVHMQISGQCEFVKQMRQSNNVNIKLPWSNQKNNNNSTSNYKASEEPKTKHPRYDTRSSKSIFNPMKQFLQDDIEASTNILFTGGSNKLQSKPSIYKPWIEDRDNEEFYNISNQRKGFQIIDKNVKPNPVQEEVDSGNVFPPVHRSWLESGLSESGKPLLLPDSYQDTDDSELESESGDEVGENIEASETIRRLKEKIQKLKDRHTCKVCMDKPVEIVFLPCNHLAACENCVPALKTCPMCRTVVKETVKVILS